MESPDQIDDAAPQQTEAADPVADVAAPSTEGETIDVTTSATVPEAADVIDLTNPAADSVADPTVAAPTVDALEDQLGQLQGAMDKLQAGDLDGAEQTIKALEDKMSSLGKLAT